MSSTITEAMRKKFSSREPNEKRRMAAQDKVMAGYARKFDLSKDLQDHLHMFFSPWLVPKRMTRGEVSMVIFLRYHQLGSISWKNRGQTMTRSKFLGMMRDVIRMMNGG